MDSSEAKTKTSSIIKKVILYVCFAGEIFLLFKVISGFVAKQDYFSLSPDFAITLVVILSISLCTLAIISQTLDKKWELFISPVIILFSSFIFLNRYRTYEALIGSVLAFLFLLYGAQRTYSMKEDFIKIKVRYSGSYVAKSFLFTISAVAALSVFLMSEHVSTIDVGQKVAEIAEKPIKEAIEQEYEKETPEEISSISLASLQESNPQVASVLRSFGITEIPTNISLSGEASENITGTIKKSISSQVNKMIEPYRKFFSPTLALLVFGILQIYTLISYFLYSQLISLIILFLRRLGFVKVEKIPTEKEVLKI